MLIYINTRRIRRQNIKNKASLKADIKLAEISDNNKLPKGCNKKKARRHI